MDDSAIGSFEPRLNEWIEFKPKVAGVVLPSLSVPVHDVGMGGGKLIQWYTSSDCSVKHSCMIDDAVLPVCRGDAVVYVHM